MGGYHLRPGVFGKPGFLAEGGLVGPFVLAPHFGAYLRRVRGRVLKEGKGGQVS